MGFLESDPTSKNWHDRRHFGVFELHGQVSSLSNVAESVLVTALATKTAAHPEIRDGDHLLIADFVFQGENGVEALDGLRKFFFGHGDHAAGHAQVGILQQGEALGGSSRKMRQQLFEQEASGEADVDPLGEVAEQDDGIILARLDGFEDLLVGREAAETGIDTAVGDVFFYLSEEVVGDIGWRNAIRVEW